MNNYVPIDESVFMSISSDSENDDFTISPPPNQQANIGLSILDNINTDDLQEEEYSRGATDINSADVYSEHDIDDNEGDYGVLSEMPDDDVLAEYEFDEHRAWDDLIYPRILRLMKICDPRIGGTRNPNHGFLFAMEFPYYNEHGLKNYRIPDDVANLGNDDGIRVLFWCASIDKKKALPVMSTSCDMLRDYRGFVKQEYMQKIVDSLHEKCKGRPKGLPKHAVDMIKKLGRNTATILDRLRIPYVLSFQKNSINNGKIEVYGTLHSKTHPAIQFIRSALNSVTYSAMKKNLLDSGTGYNDPGVTFLTSLEENDENEEEE